MYTIKIINKHSAIWHKNNKKIIKKLYVIITTETESSEIVILYVKKYGKSKYSVSILWNLTI